MKIFKNNEVICENVLNANTLIKRMVGLLGRDKFDEIDGLLLCPCSQIHSIGMKFDFDAVYLDKNDKIIELCKYIKKNKILPYNIRAKKVLELPVGVIDSKCLALGDKLLVIDV